MRTEEEALAALPRLYAQGRDPDPMIHMKYNALDQSKSWYIAEGTPAEDTYELFGMVLGSDPRPVYIMLPELRGHGAVFDPSFVPCRFSSITA